jgi:hypothetical protein
MVDLVATSNKHVHGEMDIYCRMILGMFYVAFVTLLEVKKIR